MKNSNSVQNKSKIKKVRTRLGPSPTGFAHLGTIYQAMIDKVWAEKNGGQFVLRIEDTDIKRFVEGAENVIYDSLNWFKLIPDEGPIYGGEYGPYRQSERLNLYKKYAEKLVKEDKAYYCFCSKERLDEVRKQQQNEGKQPMYDKHCRHLSKEEVQKKLDAGESHVIRMKVPENETIIVEDLIRGTIEFDSNLVDDQVIMKSDGFPTYHLAVVVDDHLMNITYVIRGPEWITSFPKHKLLYDYLGWEMPVFVHTPIINNMDGSKLSKRQGHASVDWYRRKGYLPEAVLNFIALLGWSHPEEKEIFSWQEYVNVFDLKNLSAVNPKLDLKKLDWMNGQYMQTLTNEQFLDKLYNWLTYCIDNEYVGATEYETHWTKQDYIDVFNWLRNLDEDKKLLFAEINKPRVKIFEDLLPLNNLFIKNFNIDEEFIELLNKYKNSEENKEHLEWIADLLKNSDFSLAHLKNIELQVKNRADEVGWKIMEVFYPIRVTVAGSKVSPPLFESMFILGKEKVIERFDKALEAL